MRTLPYPVNRVRHRDADDKSAEQRERKVLVGVDEHPITLDQ